MQLADTLIVLGILVAALAFLIRRWLRNVRAGQTVGSGCCGCSSGCPSGPPAGQGQCPSSGEMGDLRERD